MTNRVELAEFLRLRRESLRPADVGLAPGVRRRTPGLRREEVAQLAGMSTDYYSRLEQARGPHPSDQMLASLARALRLDADQHDHLFYLAGATPPPRRSSAGHLRPGLVRLADHLDDVPVCIISDLDEVLWQNSTADLVFGPLSPCPGRERNFTWQWFTDPQRRLRYPVEDRRRHATAHVNDLRATAARRGGDPDVESFVADLRAASAEFDELWRRHDVAARQFDRKRIEHPEVGRLELTCEVLLTPSADVRMLVFFPTEGTDARDRLDLLRVIGSQNLSPAAVTE
ncbi:helix-turn-helix protein [Jatrophihabitans sp. GAS493]|uniref:helix-turn-helix transcriptional regulator n=1 Tax=Jatrophihabitans sp. GAS493 TaxID=1907575 RepID=UPI000BB77DC6|nr:helix-turn-helix transcriptional regulator [Jatrophihabitans sp. GAS493]SOD71073.1 helix-turn-helix protein [Jatrophihabitans sp. GAS493]